MKVITARGKQARHRHPSVRRATRLSSWADQISTITDERLSCDHIAACNQAENGGGNILGQANLSERGPLFSRLFGGFVV